jgi:hypothetical protein
VSVQSSVAQVTLGEVDARSLTPYASLYAWMSTSESRPGLWCSFTWMSNGTEPLTFCRYGKHVPV